MVKRKVKCVSKRLPKCLRNILRVSRLDNYGWSCFGMILRNSIKEQPTEFWIKRSNWIYNFVNHKVMFKGSKL